MLGKRLNKVIKVYRNPNGVANTTLCLSPKSDARRCLGKSGVTLGEIFHALARQKECKILEKHLLPDQVHMCIAIRTK
jgi:hypothetical protein